MSAASVLVGSQLRKVMLLVAVISFVISVIAWPLHIYGFDATAVREEARALILQQRFAILQAPERPLDGPGEYFVRNPNNAEYYSKYGVFGAVVSMPPLLVEYFATRQLPPLDSRDRPYLLNAYNTLLTCLVAVQFARLAAFYVKKVWVIAGFVLATLFATFLWNYTRAQSSEIVQVILAVAAFDAMARWLRTDVSLTGNTSALLDAARSQRRRLLLVWCCLAALVFTRLYFLVLLPPVIAAIVIVTPRGYRTKVWWDAALPAALIVVALALLNDIKFGSPLATGYHAWEPARHQPTLNPLPGLVGFLFSAQKAIWWHFPLTLPALLGWPAFYRTHRREAKLLLAGMAIYVFPLCTIPSWAGEWSYGPRYLLFGLPLVCLPAATWAAGLSLRGEGKKRSHQLTLSLLTALLLASVYFNWQINRVEWFTPNNLRQSFQALSAVPPPPTTWHDDQPFAGRPYFDNRPWFLINHDLMWHAGDLRDMALGPIARAALTPEAFEAYRRDVWSAHQYTNLYWQTGGKRFDELKFKFPDGW